MRRPSANEEEADDDDRLCDARRTRRRTTGIARLRLNRPEVVQRAERRTAQGAARRDPGAVTPIPTVRVVLLTGEGRNFCAGGDIHTFESKGAELPDYLREATAWLQLASAALIQLRVPVVTAVQGFAAGGGGLGLVCASDIVVAAESAKFFSGAVRVGHGPRRRGVGDADPAGRATAGAADRADQSDADRRRGAAASG